ncbi:MAG: DUF86 domain-containing protein [Deltaproteobacteria bacterium]|nr:DUF86 domain-containing protein [Deltaproteobacteria bacterium]
MLKLVSELRKSITRLREISKLSQKDFLGDPDKIGSSKYHFIVAIESTIDMCNHIIARNGYIECHINNFTALSVVVVL